MYLRGVYVFNGKYLFEYEILLLKLVIDITADFHDGQYLRKADALPLQSAGLRGNYDLACQP